MMKTKVGWFGLFWLVVLGSFLLFVVGSIALEIYYIKTSPKKMYCVEVDYVNGATGSFQFQDYEGATFCILGNKGTYYLASFPPWWGHSSAVRYGVMNYKLVTCK